MKIVIGIDVGGSTTKIVGYTEECQQVGALCVTATDPTTSVYGALGRFVSENKIQLSDICHILLTGVGVSHLDGDIYGIPTGRVAEFEAIGIGGLALSNKQSALVVSMGTGTAFIRANSKTKELTHIGGSGVGGGTLLGLCDKLTGVRDFDNIIELSKNGDTSKVDLSIGDISKTKIGTLSENITASNFGKHLENPNGADMALGVLNMVFQTIGMLGVFACLNSDVNDVVVTGMLTNAPQAKVVFEMLEKMYNVSFIIPQQAIYCTAIGAALSYFKNE